MDVETVTENDTCAEEADAGYHLRCDPGWAGFMVKAGGENYKGGCTYGDKCVGAKACGTLSCLPFGSDQCATHECDCKLHEGRVQIADHVHGLVPKDRNVGRNSQLLTTINDVRNQETSAVVFVHHVYKPFEQVVAILRSR